MRPRGQTPRMHGDGVPLTPQKAASMRPRGQTPRMHEMDDYNAGGVEVLQ